MKKHAIAGIATAAALSCCLFTGCMAPQQDQAASEESKACRAYMSAVHQVVNRIDEQTALLSSAVALGEYAQAAQCAANVGTQVKSLDALSVPDALKDVHRGYSEGCAKLSAALSEYVTYRSASAGESGESSAVASAMASMKLSSIQSNYDAGVLLLTQADALAASL